MSGSIRLQKRDIELLVFLGKYKIISLDNTKNIYGTITYQEKRIVALVKHKYIKRLKHRYIVLGTSGKEYLKEKGYEIKEHCRNKNNIERLKVISDIAVFFLEDGYNFIPSWDMKNKKEPTTDSRRYIGKVIQYEEEFLVYEVYGEKTDRYITSIYYDIRKERNKGTNVMIFTNNLEKIVLNRNPFVFGGKYTLVIPYTEYGKYLLKNSFKIRWSTYLRLKKLYDGRLTDFEYADVEINENIYVLIMPTINLQRLGPLYGFIRENKKMDIHIFGPQEYEELIIKFFDGCNYKSLSREKMDAVMEEFKNEL